MHYQKMASQSVFRLSLYNPKIEIESSNRHCFSHQIRSVTVNHQRFQSKCARKFSSTVLKWVNRDFSALRLNKGAKVHSSISDLGKKLFTESDSENVTVSRNDEFDPFRGRPGSVSFHGLTHQMVEGARSDFKPGSGSFLWLAGCVVLMLSYILPPVLIGGVANIMIKDAILAEILVSLSSEAAFYTGFATFLMITDRVQKPYMQTSPKRWSLITGLRGYTLSSFVTTCLKIVVPLLAVYISWSEIGLDGLVAVAPFLLGCLAQFMFEISLRVRGSSCWPLVPIIFEMYRICQINRAVYFIERLVYAMGELPKSLELMERGDALVGMVMMLQVLGLVCLWSLITFLVALFPSNKLAVDGN